MAGRPAIEATLRETLPRTRPGNFHIPGKRTPPRWITRAGADNIEALFEFETAYGPGAGVLRLKPDSDGALRAWTLNTNLQELRGYEEEFRRRGEPDSTRDFGAENWADRLKKQRAFADSDPAVVVVGGGQAGLSIAARLHQLGVDTLIVDRHPRVGDNWRTRYHSLTLHNEVYVNHLPYLHFPPTFPVYIPKDKLANWFEFYVEALELNFWTGTELAAGAYDAWKNRSLLALADAWMWLVGLAVSFISAFVVIRWLIRYVATHDFRWFAWYRIAFGIVVLLTAHFGWVSWTGL